jgi:lysophospholipase L1-like esterase
MQQRIDRPWAKVTILTTSVTVALIVAALAGEVAARYREQNRSSVPTSTPLLYYRHARLGHALVRNTDYYGWIRTNADGFRGPDIELTKPPDVFRVLALGASTTFDGSVSGDDRTWPARLQYWLNELLPNSRVEVINAGVPGYEVIDNLIRLQTELYKYRPDIVLLYHTHNDLFNSLESVAIEKQVDKDRPDEVRAVSLVRHWLSQHSMLFTKLMARFRYIRFSVTGRKAVGNVPEADHVWPLAVERAATQFQRDLASFLAVAENLGITVVLPQVVHVSGPGATVESDPDIHEIWHRSVPFAPVDVVLQGYARFDEVVRATSERFGATYVPAGEFGEMQSPSWYADGDPIHFNDVGADQMAQHLAQAMISLGLVNASEVGAATNH